VHSKSCICQHTIQIKKLTLVILYPQSCYATNAPHLDIRSRRNTLQMGFYVFSSRSCGGRAWVFWWTAVISSENIWSVTASQNIETQSGFLIWHGFKPLTKISTGTYNQPVLDNIENKLDQQILTLVWQLCHGTVGSFRPVYGYKIEQCVHSASINHMHLTHKTNPLFIIYYWLM